MAQEITLFDLPSTNGNHCWSPNTWKARIYLNYKGLPYKTVWVEYPDIKATLKGHVAPDDAGIYTLPAVLLPDGTYIMDSKNIATELDKRYPESSAHLDSAMLSEVDAILLKIKSSLLAESIPQVPKLFLNEASRLFFLETRAKKFGITLDQLEKEKGGAQCFVNVRPHIRELAALLKKNPDGPFFEGQKVTFADLVWASQMKFYQRISEELLDKILAEDREVHFTLLEACKPWLKRDNY